MSNLINTINSCIAIVGEDGLEMPIISVAIIKQWCNLAWICLRLEPS